MAYPKGYTPPPRGHTPSSGNDLKRFYVIKIIEEWIHDELIPKLSNTSS